MVLSINLKVVFMSTYLITGISGFVGRHLVSCILQKDKNACIYGVGKRACCDLGTHYFRMDLKNQEQVSRLLKKVRPDFIIHLASMSSVQESWNNPQECFDVNANVIINVLTAVKDNNLSSRILTVGSSEVYGNYPEHEMPLKETYPLNPISPYAVTKLFQENICKVYADSFGLDIVMTRSFNHFGAGQDDKFFIPSLVKQLLEIKNGDKKTLLVGNIDIKRDFIHVNDVAEIYYKLLYDGKKGEVYNVCSGKPVLLREIVTHCCSILNINPEIIVDRQRVRPNDIYVIYGDNSKVKSVTGWQQKYFLESSLKDIILGNE